MGCGRGRVLCRRALSGFLGESFEAVEFGLGEDPAEGMMTVR